jgi:hypothetical protein
VHEASVDAGEGDPGRVPPGGVPNEGDGVLVERRERERAVGDDVLRVGPPRPKALDGLVPDGEEGGIGELADEPRARPRKRHDEAMLAHGANADGLGEPSAVVAGAGVVSGGARDREETGRGRRARLGSENALPGVLEVRRGDGLTVRPGRVSAQHEGDPPAVAARLPAAREAGNGLEVRTQADERVEDVQDEVLRRPVDCECGVERVGSVAPRDRQPVAAARCVALPVGAAARRGRRILEPRAGRGEYADEREHEHDERETAAAPSPSGQDATA